MASAPRWRESEDTPPSAARSQPVDTREATPALSTPGERTDPARAKWAPRCPSWHATTA